MKNVHLFLVAAIVFVAVSCSKTYTVPVYTPDSNMWLVNTDTFGPAKFTYDDNTNVLYGGVKGKGAVYVYFRSKPTQDGSYVLRANADELGEVTILVTDSVKKIAWLSTDDDGLALKKEQFADVKVNGKSIAISFNEFWLKETMNVNKAKISLNIN
jgi:hypothetical protein